jgi:hypothetical protein
MEGNSMSEMQEVEVPEVDETTETPAEASTETKTEAKPKGKRAKLPEGWGTPIQFNNALTKYLRETGVLAEDDDDHRPQVIYSYIKNKSKDHPFPVHYVTEAGEERPEDDDETRPALKLAGSEDGRFPEFGEAFLWWEEKEERVKNRKANAAKKAAEKKDKAASKPATDATEPAPNELAEVEEAE